MSWFSFYMAVCMPILLQQWTARVNQNIPTYRGRPWHGGKALKDFPVYFILRKESSHLQGLSVLQAGQEAGGAGERVRIYQSER